MSTRQKAPPKRTGQPINNQVERAVLGAFVMDAEQFATFRGMLLPADFYEPKHQALMIALSASYEEGSKEFDVALVNDQLQQMGKYHLWPAWQSETLVEAGSSLQAPKYAVIVFENAYERAKHGVADALASGRFDAPAAIAQLAALDERKAKFYAGEACPPAAGDVGWQPKPQSAADLMRKVLPPVRWAVEGLLPEGVNLLAAKAKKGKSTLMLHVACAIAQGALVMSHFETKQSEVLYLALEDNERRMQKRLRNMLQPGESAPAGLHFAYEWPALDMGGDKALDDYLDAHPAIKVVVIDTLEHIRAKRRSPNGSYSDDYAAVRGLQQMAGRRQLCVVAISHLRKAPADDPFDEINATMGLLASVDNALVMRSVQGIVELHRRGRDYEDDTVLALKGDAKSLLWKVEGNAEEVTRSAERKGILEALAAAVPDAMSSQDLATVTKNRDGNVRFLLKKMLDDGEVIRPERGQYTIPTNNANNANNADGKSGRKRDKPLVSDVSDPKSPTNNANNAFAPLLVWPDARDVSDVSNVSGSIQNGHKPTGPVCLKCGAPKELDPGGGYNLTCQCGAAALPVHTVILADCAVENWHG